MQEQIRVRLNLLTLTILVVIGLLAMRLVKLQIVDSDLYSGKTRQSSIQEEVRHAARGLVYDRNGMLIATNEPTYTMQITPRFFKKEKAQELAELLGRTEKEILDKEKEARDYTPLRPYPVFKEVPFSVVSKIEEMNYEFPGVDFVVEQKRRYSSPRAAHILGYIKEISKTQLDARKVEGYRRGDVIGQSGIERFYETEMRGEPGLRLVMKNAHGQVVSAYREGKEDKDPISGYTFHLSIDGKIQALAEKMLRNKRGGLVAIDPNTGEILALASGPDYNPALLSGAVDRDVWIGLNRDPSKPLYNRATLSVQPPGSTFKPFMSLIALQDGAVTEDSKIYCNGGWGTHKCMGVHGGMDVRNAIRNSCNTFYYTLMTRLNFARWTNWAHEFGFGVKPDVDIIERSKGIIPDSAYYDKMYGGRNRWKTSNLVILGIGQGLTVSPLQLANYVATVANGGTRYMPHLVKYMINPAGKKVYPVITPPKKLPIKPAYFAAVQEGMRRSAMEHTRNVVWDPQLKVAGKTGTAQAPGRGRKDHSVFIGFAPLDKPKIAVAVLIENAGFGATAAAPMASLMMELYVTGKMSRQGLVNSVSAVPSQGFERKIDWTKGVDTVLTAVRRAKELAKTSTGTTPSGKPDAKKPANAGATPAADANNQKPETPSTPKPTPKPNTRNQTPATPPSGTGNAAPNRR